MLFNSYEFLYLFLPVTLLVFFALAGAQYFRTAAAWLALVSIGFYGYWNPRYVVLLLLSMAFNFWMARAIVHCQAASRPVQAKQVLVLALVINLLALGYFKYANFMVDTVNAVSNMHLELAKVLLPIGISFFTFTQIAFLVDTHAGKVRESRAIPYVLFVTFFPHLIAGPVLHHAEMMPQFARDSTYRFALNNFLVGATFFAMGLFKKVVLADGIQPFVGPVFDADAGQVISVVEAWGGVLAYTLQLYFDFSGYSDMAIGLAKMFNVDLPLNFNSPYKAANIAEFWRRWHMTLSRFLRDYLYIPLGGNRKGPAVRYLNLLATMLLGGLWHGAGWTFVIWGGLHGIYLIAHQAWQTLRLRLSGGRAANPSAVGRVASTGLTFLCVVVAWVFFRANSVQAALSVLEGMVGFNGFKVPPEWQQAWTVFGLEPWSWVKVGSLELSSGWRQVGWTFAMLMIAWFLPNSQELIAKLQRGIVRVDLQRWGWFSLGLLAVAVFALAAINGSRGSSEFIYFNF